MLNSGVKSSPMSRSTTSITGHALLGLLSIRSWTAYELTQQMRRAVRWAWPRSEANLYNEIKRLVPPGLAEAIDEDVGSRSRTRYEITDEGRAAVAAWLSTLPSSGPQVQSEALLRVFLADQGTIEDLRRTVAETRAQALDTMHEAIPILEQYSSGHPPFPGRAHLNVLFIQFFAQFLHLVLEWCDDAETELETWGGTTTDVGLTPGTRQMLEVALTRYRTTTATHRPEEPRP
jgi:PadR family transcriptional regulator, regulatory protein AphA